ncbi:MAG: hypothetical protein ACKPKO_02285, partial [Candidatus Fonsibacter sp.]
NMVQPPMLLANNIGNHALHKLMQQIYQRPVWVPYIQSTKRAQHKLMCNICGLLDPLLCEEIISLSAAVLNILMCLLGQTWHGLCN